MANIRYSGMRPINQHSLNQRVLPGQYKRLGGTNVFTNYTFIQNNFGNGYNCGGFGGGYGCGGFGAYDYGCVPDNSFFGKFMNVVGAAGIVTALTGFVMSLCGKKDDVAADVPDDKKTAKDVADPTGKETVDADPTGKETVDPTGKNPTTVDEPKTEVLADGTKVTVKGNVKTEEKPDGTTIVTVTNDDGTKTVTTTTKDGVTTTKTLDANGNEIKDVTPSVTVDLSAIADGLELSCRDASGNTAPISGTLSDVTKGEDGVPNSFCITDKGGKYKFELKEIKDGKPIYECVSRDGKKASVESEYTFEGKELVQYLGQKNYGQGLRFGAASGAAKPDETKKGGYSIGADKALSHTKTKAEVTSKKEALELLDTMNKSDNPWKTYAEFGSNLGNTTYFKGAIGGIGFYTNDKKEIGKLVNKMLADVPKELHKDESYIALQEYAAKLENGFADVNYEKVDRHLMALAKKMENKGTDYIANKYLKGPAGSNVMITPDMDNVYNSYRSDAKFSLPTEGSDTTKDFYFYRGSNTITGKTYDFQDIVGDGGLIYHDPKANNGKGGIKFDASKLEEGKTYFFKTSGGEQLKVQVNKNGQAYVTGQNGKNVLLEDVLNGRAKMPE